MTGPSVAIVGSGPSAYYTAEELLKAGATVDMIERLPTPYGLVRSGVAPDHQKIKSVSLLFDRISSHPSYAFWGNITIGRDVSIPELLGAYDSVVLACGASEDARLAIPGEDSRGSYAAGEFVAWYNGHPDYRDHTFDLNHESVVIIGQGNVALDVCRILLTPPEQLSTTDIAEHALDVLRKSKVKEVHLIGRRGPAQASFTTSELRDILNIEDCSVHINADEIALDAVCAEIVSQGTDALRRNLDLLTGSNPRENSGRKLFIRFLSSPIEIIGSDHVEKARMVRNRLVGGYADRRAQPTKETFEIACGAIFRSVGFRAKSLKDVPFDDRRGIVPNLQGRVVDLENRLVSGLYVVGWMKRGANGVIGTNRMCGQETAKSLLADVSHSGGRAVGPDKLQDLLVKRGLNVVDFEGWKRIDQAEQIAGQVKKKPREKFTRFSDLLSAANA